MCGCSHMTTTTMELPSLVCLCVLISCGVSSADANEPVKVVVMEEDDAILPCSLSTKENIDFKLFDWKKDGQKEVFMYDGGIHYNNGRSGQDEQFKGRVSHFSDQLKNGIASIKIQNMKGADSGNYTCDFPRLQPSQTFHIELVVDAILKDRTKEKNSGAAAKPSVTILDETNDWSLLQCEVRGVSPKPEVEWKDGSGNIVPAEEPKVTKNGDKYDVILNTTVTKTDYYHCVATQEEIHHQIDVKIFVHISGAALKPYVKSVQTEDGMKVQCEVLGVSPEPEVEWKDSSGNIVPAEEPEITRRGENYDVILLATVTKTDRYRCVVTQKEINHQTENDVDVTVEKSSQGDPTGWIVAAVFCALFVAAVIVLLKKHFHKKGSNRYSTPEGQNLNSQNSQT